jgi:GTP cyclohydrolase I
MAKHKRVVNMPLALAKETSFAPEVRKILEQLVDDPDRDGLTLTPQRVEKALRFLTSGYRADVRRVVNGALFPCKYDEMVIV